MFNFLKFGTSLFIALSLSGCAGNLLQGLGFESDTPKFWAVYNRIKSETDDLAKAGKMTWVEASIRVRDADKRLADNKAGYDTSWKFDSDDEEYHAYVIAIAERLDQKLISFAAFDASRIAKRNEIDARRQSIDLQRKATRSSVQPTSGIGIMCALDREIPANTGTHCVYNCVGNEVIQTVGPAQICPIQIRK